MSENARPEQETVSVDGALYAILDGEWTKVGFAADPNEPYATPFSLPEGHVSLDGAVYVISDGE